ncbi:hypothetical protein ACFRCQ_27420 [Cytobacillus firmus]|uniref:hypothetical protein n=1 Tax=Cytobacillus firmus TaxID=1399 RepID=UPI00368C8379
MAVKKTFFGISFLLVAFLMYVFFFSDFSFGKEKNESSSTVEASISTDKPLMDLSTEEAEKFVPFNVEVPDAPEGLNNPVTNVVLPPDNAVSDEEAVKNLTRIETIYESKKNKDEGIVVVQTNNEIVQIDESGNPVEPKTMNIGDKEVNYYDCECTPKRTIYSWYDGKVSTEITVFGDIKLEKVEHLIKKLSSKKQ